MSHPTFVLCAPCRGCENFERYILFMQEELTRKLAEINHKTVEIEKRDAKIAKMQRLIREIKALDDDVEDMEIE